MATKKTTENEKVPVYLFKDNGKYADDVFVAVNGRPIVIQRGEAVEVEKKYAEVLTNSQRQDKDAADYMQSQSDQYNSDRVKFNI